MASVNKVILIGNLGRDPDIRYGSESGQMFGSFSIATTSRRRAPDGSYSEETDWHRISVFGKQAEFVKNYLRKGLQVYVEGRLRNRKYDKDGQTIYVTDIWADSVQILGRKADNTNFENQGSSAQSSNFTTPPPAQSRQQVSETKAPPSAMSPSKPQENTFAEKAVDDFADDDIPF